MPPPLIVEDGVADLTSTFVFTAKQSELNNLNTPYRLGWGGIRSAKTTGALMYAVYGYLLPYPGCSCLFLRRTLSELKEGGIANFKAHVPQELYSWVSSPRPMATFINGSKLIFGHSDNAEASISQYLGQAMPIVIIDECGQFSKESWDFIGTRNIVNPECQPNVSAPCGGCGNPLICGYPCMPTPVMIGLSNPIGPHWDFYKTEFIDKAPYDPPEDAVKDDTTGCWWVLEAGNPICCYDPTKLGEVKSTVLDNPHELRRDPGIVERLMSKPKVLRDRMLYGYLDSAAGSYFEEAWDETAHVVDMRNYVNGNPPVIWEPWQPCWVGWDFGFTHWNSIVVATKAQVRVAGGNYKRKNIIIKEIIEKGKTGIELVNILKARCQKHPGFPVCLECLSKGLEICPHVTLRPSTIYFSHEKFSRQLTAHSPADELNKELKRIGWPAVSTSQGTKEARIGGATLIYSLLRHGNLVVLDSCPEIIKAIPRLQRDPDSLEDVLKPEGISKTDDVYDGLRFCLYGYLNSKEKSQQAANVDRLNSMDEFSRKLEIYRLQLVAAKAAEPSFGNKTQSWKERL